MSSFLSVSSADSTPDLAEDFLDVVVLFGASSSLSVRFSCLLDVDIFEDALRAESSAEFILDPGEDFREEAELFCPLPSSSTPLPVWLTDDFLEEIPRADLAAEAALDNVERSFAS